MPTRSPRTSSPHPNIRRCVVAALSFLDRDRTMATPGFSRWLLPPAALAIHLCIGQVYAASVYKTALVAHFHTSLTAIGLSSPSPSSCFCLLYTSPSPRD